MYVESSTVDRQPIAANHPHSGNEQNLEQYAYTRCARNHPTIWSAVSGSRGSSWRVWRLARTLTLLVLRVRSASLCGCGGPQAVEEGERRLDESKRKEKNNEKVKKRAGGVNGPTPRGIRS